MISRREVFEMHQLRDQGFSLRAIAKQLQVNRETVTKYLTDPGSCGNKAETKEIQT